jgi:hypothetical protein
LAAIKEHVVNLASGWITPEYAWVSVAPLARQYRQFRSLIGSVAIRSPGTAIAAENNLPLLLLGGSK